MAEAALAKPDGGPPQPVPETQSSAGQAAEPDFAGRPDSVPSSPGAPTPETPRSFEDDSEGPPVSTGTNPAAAAGPSPETGGDSTLVSGFPGPGPGHDQTDPAEAVTPLTEHHRQSRAAPTSLAASAPDDDQDARSASPQSAEGIGQGDISLTGPTPAEPTDDSTADTSAAEAEPNTAKSVPADP